MFSVQNHLVMSIFVSFICKLYPIKKFDVGFLTCFSDIMIILVLSWINSILEVGSNKMSFDFILSYVFNLKVINNK